MEESRPPLSPRTLAIIALSQQLQSHEDAISLLCQAREQDLQLARLKEEKHKEQPANSRKTAIILLHQVGVKGVLIAQAVISRHYIREGLQAAIKKSNLRPQIKTLLHEAAPDISLVMASGLTCAIPVVVSKVEQLSFEQIKNVSSKAWAGMVWAKEALKGKAVFAWNSCIESMISSLEHELSMQVYLRLSKGKSMLYELSKRKEDLLKSTDYSIHAEKEVKKIDDAIDKVKNALECIDVSRKSKRSSKSNDYEKLFQLEQEMKTIDTHITVLNSSLSQLKNSGQLSEVTRSLLELSVSALILERRELESVRTGSETVPAIPLPKIFYSLQEKGSPKQSGECDLLISQSQEHAGSSVIEFTFQLPENAELDKILEATLQDLDEQDCKRALQVQEIS